MIIQHSLAHCMERVLNGQAVVSSKRIEYRLPYAIPQLLGRRFRYVGRSRSLAIYRADLGRSLRGRLSNALRQLAQLAWFAKNVALKVALSLGVGKLLRRLGRSVPEWPY